jgi:hypothetical protein
MQKKFDPFETQTNVLMSDSLKDEISSELLEKISVNKKPVISSNPKFIFQLNDNLISVNIKKFNINNIKLEYNVDLLKHLLDKISVDKKYETEIAFIIKIDDLELLKEYKLIDISFTKKSITLQFLNTY